MDATTLIVDLSNDGIILQIGADGKLEVKAPRGTLNSTYKSLIKANINQINKEACRQEAERLLADELNRDAVCINCAEIGPMFWVRSEREAKIFSQVYPQIPNYTLAELDLKLFWDTNQVKRDYEHKKENNNSNEKTNETN